MKILYFHQHFSTPHGATGTRSYEMAKRLVQAGHEVTMICGSYSQSDTGANVEKKFWKEGEVEGIKVIEFPLPYQNKDSFLKRCFTFARFAIMSLTPVFLKKYDLLFATSTPLTAAFPGIVAKIFLRKPFIFEVRDLWPELPRAMGVIKNRPLLMALDILESLAYFSADKIIALSPGMKEGILKKVPQKEVVVIPNGCDLELFNPQKKFNSSIMGIDQDDFVAIFSGTHGKANGLQSLIDVSVELKSRGERKIKILLIGDGLEKQELKKLAADSQLDNCVFLDPVPKVQLQEYFTRANVGLMILKNIPAFYRGTSPNKFFDYLSAGLPILVNYPGWMAEIIEKNHLGLPVPPENPSAFAEALITMKNDPEFCQVAGRNARNLAEQEFSRSNLGRNFVKFLESYRAKKPLELKKEF